MGISSQNQQTSVSLLDRLRVTENERDWEMFVTVYDGLIIQWLRRAGVDSDDVEDLKQEILLAVVAAVPSFEHNGRVGAFRKWLKTLVSHRVLNHFRKRNDGKSSATVNASLADLVAVEDRMLSLSWEREHDEYVLQQLMKIVEIHFTNTTWTAFKRQVLEHQSVDNVAEELGITPNAALIAKSRVLRRLRQEAAGLVD